MHSLHPFETSPLLGTRQQTQGWGQLVRELDQDDNVDLDEYTAESSLENVRSPPENPEQSARQREFSIKAFQLHAFDPLLLVGRAHMNRSLSAVVKQRSRYYVPVSAVERRDGGADWFSF